MNKELLKLLGMTETDPFAEELKDALAQMEQELAALCDCKDPALSDDLRRVIQSGGKRLRPVLAWLGYMAGREDENRTSEDLPVVPLMTAAELVHTSSLIHDDIVDEAFVRRSAATINATSGNYRAVQAGDYLLARAAKLARPYKDLRLDRHFALVAKGMCEAEFMQMESSFRLNDSSLSVYFEQIRRKTAAFIAAAVALGGKAGGASEKTVDMLEAYGLNAGIAFQIRDDVLDFAADKDFGKKCGKDLEQGIFTLPLLMALKEADAASAKKAKQAALKREKTEEDISGLLQFVKESGALKTAQEEIEQYTKEAVKAIDALRPGRVKDALTGLADGLSVRCM